MTDREQVISNLKKSIKYHEHMKETFCKECILSMNMAIAMLKEQEHGETFTVIDTKTGKEADEYAIALYEDWAKHLCYCDMEGWAIEDDGTLLLVDECGRFAYADRERFKVVWDA